MYKHYHSFDCCRSSIVLFIKIILLVSVVVVVIAIANIAVVYIGFDFNMYNKQW